MCGIAGFVGGGGEDDLVRMTDALAHRGPDAEGRWADSSTSVWLGHRRLAIVDLAGGDQPMWTADGDLGVVFNGEIYNHRELRGELEKAGHRFRSDHSDTETLLYAYREWGSGFVERLNGMWAFALYDKRRRRLLLSRDRFGKKPLYWTRQGGTFAFASELSALTEHSRVEARLSTTALRKYFAYGYVPAPRSVFENVEKLPAGCSLLLDVGSLRHELRRWWQFRLEPFERLPRRPEESWGEELLERLSRAVRRRLMADVPLGAFLSGGIDSSAVAALAARELAPGRLDTFAIGFEEASFDESGPAERAARHLGTRHRTTRFSVETLRELAPVVAGGIDEPLADSSLLATTLLCREARQDVRVALSGDGADELFAGYDPFRALRWAELYARLVPRPCHRAIRLLAGRLPTSHRNLSLDFKIKRTLAGLSHPPRLWNPLWLAPLGPAEIAQLFDEPVDEEELYSEALEAWDDCASGSLVDQTLQFFTRLYLQNGIVTKVDRASMACSLEVRSPFLDVEVVDFVRRIPADYKLRGGETKFLLKRALAPVLPDWILRRSKKGFGVPVGRWFQEGRLGFGSALEGTSAGAGFLRARLAEHRQGRADHRLYLWSHWLLDRWRGARG
jgi:asparagine synthase (glutamine-hydrolysing)